MSKVGKFIFNKFKDQTIKIWTSTTGEEVHYADSDISSQNIFVGVVTDYDEESGVLTLQAPSTNQLYYISEFYIELFWLSDFDVRDVLDGTIRKPH